MTEFVAYAVINRVWWILPLVAVLALVGGRSHRHPGGGPVLALHAVLSGLCILTPSQPAHDVFHHVRAVRRWAPWILLTGIVGAAIMGGTALLEAKTYEASAEILVSQPPDLNFSFVERPLSATAERKIENEIQLLSSAAIADSVEEAGGPRLSPSASSLGDSDVIRISIRGGRSGRAGRRAQRVPHDLRRGAPRADARRVQCGRRPNRDRPSRAHGPHGRAHHAGRGP